MSYESLRQKCDTACHQRKACTNGYKQFLASDNISELMSTWRKNWDEIVNGLFVNDIIRHFPEEYLANKQEINQSGIYLNECPVRAQMNTLVLIINPQGPVDIFGNAKAYVLSCQQPITCYDHSQIYNHHAAEATITLRNYSYGDITKGKVTAQDRSELQCACDATLNGAVRCRATGGTVRIIRYRTIQTYNDAQIIKP